MCEKFVPFFCILLFFMGEKTFLIIADHKLKWFHFSFPCICPSVSDHSVVQYAIWLFILWSGLYRHQKKSTYIQLSGKILVPCTGCTNKVFSSSTDLLGTAAIALIMLESCTIEEHSSLLKVLIILVDDYIF